MLLYADCISTHCATIFCTTCWNTSSAQQSATEYRRKSSAQVAIESVIRFALSELGGKFDITCSMLKATTAMLPQAEAAGWMLCWAVSCFFFVTSHHRLSGRCIITITSSASCVLSTIRCQLAFRKSTLGFCKSIQNRPRRDASKNWLFLPPLTGCVHFSVDWASSYLRVFI